MTNIKSTSITSNELTADIAPMNKYHNFIQQLKFIENYDSVLIKLVCDLTLTVKDHWDMPRSVENYITTQNHELAEIAQNEVRHTAHLEYVGAMNSRSDFNIRKAEAAYAAAHTVAALRKFANFDNDISYHVSAAVEASITAVTMKIDKLGKKAKLKKFQLNVIQKKLILTFLKKIKQ